MFNWSCCHNIYANFSLLFVPKVLYKYSTMSQNIEQILNDLKSALKTGAPASAGITDSASRQQIAINDNGVVLTKLRLDRVLGDLNVDNKVVSSEVSTTTVNATNINVTNEISAGVIRAKKIITDQDQDSYNRAITFYGDALQALDGKGLLFSQPDFTHQFIFKTDSQRLFSTENIDLYRGKKYQINGVAVIEEGRLSDSIVHSNLTSVGTLTSLRVENGAQFGQTLFVNDSYGRVSVNTEEMHGALTVYEGGATIIIGGDEGTGAGKIGTWGPNRLSIVTDNTERIAIQGNQVEFGNSKSKNSDVKVNGSVVITNDLRIDGTLRVANLIADTRIQRSSNLEFISNETESVYGKGIQWKGEGYTRSFALAPNFDRFVSSENIDLINNRAYYINKVKVIDHQSLGDGIKTSSLTRVGTLEELNVAGGFTVENHIEIKGNNVSVFRPFSIKDVTGDLTFTGNSLTTTSKDFALVADTDKIISIDNLGNIALGDRQRTDRIINAYGKLSINVTNPDPEVDLQVNGMIMVGGKKFINASQAPSTGVWTKGDIAWNSQPEDTGFIGWVCITGGRPGVWKPFGYIGQ